MRREKTDINNCDFFAFVQNTKKRNAESRKNSDKEEKNNET